MAINIYTHEEIFQFRVKTKPWNKMIILNNNFLLFEDGSSSINVYDIRHKLLRARSSKIATYALEDIQPGEIWNTNTAWC